MWVDLVQYLSVNLWQSKIRTLRKQVLYYNFFFYFSLGKTFIDWRDPKGHATYFHHFVLLLLSVVIRKLLHFNLLLETTDLLQPNLVRMFIGLSSTKYRCIFLFGNSLTIQEDPMCKKGLFGAEEKIKFCLRIKPIDFVLYGSYHFQITWGQNGANTLNVE